jgi:hypothetical protein
VWNGRRVMARINPVMALPFEIMGRTARASSAIIMEHIVPMQKLGVFSDLVSQWLRRNPDADPVEMTKAMQSIWRSVDNRLGEMVYDNKFWNRTFKDSLHLGVRALGWNFGTIEEIGGAPVDVVKAIDKKIRTGKVTADDWGHKAPYVFGLMFTAALVGATLQYLMTGNGPEDLKDLAFPRTGRFEPDGTAERISLPSYVKDIWEYYHHPGTTLVHKANPIFGQFADQWTGTDYFGHPIYDPTDENTLWDWHTADRLKHFVQAAAPFSFQGQKQMQGAGEPGWTGKAFTVAPYIGVTPAPGAVTKPERIESFEHSQMMKGWQKKLQYELKKAKEAGDTQKAAEIHQQLAETKRAIARDYNAYKRDKNAQRSTSKLPAAAPDARLGFPARQQAEQRKTSALMDKIGPLIDGSSSRAEMAAKIEKAGYPALAGLIGSLPDTLRPQVHARLRAHA